MMCMDAKILKVVMDFDKLVKGKYIYLMTVKLNFYNNVIHLHIFCLRVMPLQEK
jgi:hypothetical protein